MSKRDIDKFVVSKKKWFVIHELAHITEMNHSGRFRAIVEGVLPDYKERQKRLKVLQKKLSMENWE